MIGVLIYACIALVIAIGTIVYFVMDNPTNFQTIDDTILALMIGIFWPIVVGVSLCFGLVLLIIAPFVLMGSKLQDKLTR